MTDPRDIPDHELDRIVDGFWRVLCTAACADGWTMPRVSPSIRDRLRKRFAAMYRAGRISAAGVPRVAPTGVTPDQLFKSLSRVEHTVVVTR